MTIYERQPCDSLRTETVARAMTEDMTMCTDSVVGTSTAAKDDKYDDVELNVRPRMSGQ